MVKKLNTRHFLISFLIFTLLLCVFLPQTKISFHSQKYKKLNALIPHQSDTKLLWNFTTDDDITSVAISSDGNYIVAGSKDNQIYLFNHSSFLSKTPKTPMWNYTTGDEVNSVAISSDIFYIIAGSNDNHAYLFNNISDSTQKWNYTM